MGEPGSDRIWKPLVKPTEVDVPRPGSAIGVGNELLEQFYTKTSLVSEHQNNSHERSLNREILSASQSFNNTPKPFTRSQTLGQQSSTATNSTGHSSTNQSSGNRETQPFGSNSNITAQKWQQQQSYQDLRSDHQEFSKSSPSSSASSLNSKITAVVPDQSNSSPSSTKIRSREEQQGMQEESMAPKLVHKQYNSPIDLYSMNNIRKTIEAHTEFIAPGLKGINFMKPDAPVNKQSEVYKLVMEEEEQRARRQDSFGPADSAIDHTVGNQASPSPTAQLNRLNPHLSTNHAADSARDGSSEHYHKIVQRQLIESQRAFEKSGAPVCLACGQSIRGPFAKIRDQAIHPQCFNCSTCGASLKNSGYFTVNEKIYCNIHAKQVASMMRLNYNFNETQRHQHEGGCHETGVKQEQQAASTLSPTTSRQQCSKNTTRSATISTMFANNDHSQHNEIGNTANQSNSWSWKPAKSEDSHNKLPACSLLSSPTVQATSSTLYRQQHQQCQHQKLASVAVQTPPGPASQCNSHQQQSTIQLSSSRNQGFLKETGALVGGSRIPVCAHCQVQIRGPYILAGTTTWCKQCSQTQFKCSSCSRSLLNLGFIEDNSQRYYCEHCFEAYHAPICSKCNIRIKGDCLNALSKQWHPSCFVCGHCHRPFGNSSFYLEDNVPYCERDWNVLFTTKCYACSYPIEAGDKWIEALDRSYHSNCFRCTSCQTNLEGSTFYCKGSKPYCRLHAR